MSTQNQPEVGPAIEASHITPAVYDPIEHLTPVYRCTYGVRLDDFAGVVHFYRLEGAPWHPDFPVKLQRAVEAALDVSKVNLGYVEKLDSFYLIVGELGELEDPYAPLEATLKALDRQLGL